MDYRFAVIVAGLTLTMLGGCATDPNAPVVVRDKDYATGSHLARRYTSDADVSTIDGDAAQNSDLFRNHGGVPAGVTK